MRPRLTGLWQNQDFLKLWAGQTISTFGSMVGSAALSFAAILSLDATPFQMGLLAACGLLPGFLFGLAAGAWVDRLRRRPVLIAADLGRAALLASIPLSWMIGVLRIEQLYAVALLTGALAVCFDVAYLSYLPSLVERDQLLEGNSKLAASNAAAEVAGFSIAGWLVQLFTAPVVILIDALSFLAPAASLSWIRSPEPPPARATRTGILHEIAIGLRQVLGDGLLGPLAASAVTLDIFGRFTGTVIVLFMVRDLGFQPGVLGLIWAIGGVTSILGSMAAGDVARRLGVGRTMVLAVFVTGLGTLFVPVAGGPAAAVAACLIANQLVTDPAWTIFEVTQVSLRQAVAPAGLLGRINGSIRFASLGGMLLAVIAAGALGDAAGLRATLLIGVGGMWLAMLPLLLSPVRSLARLPVALPEVSPAPAARS